MNELSNFTGQDWASLVSALASLITAIAALILALKAHTRINGIISQIGSKVDDIHNTLAREDNDESERQKPA